MFMGIRLGDLSDIRFQGHAFITVIHAFIIVAQSELSQLSNFFLRCFDLFKRLLCSVRFLTCVDG